ncbi:hypothetical protein As57867_003664, partial [Aphanomyces stellatus]
MATRHPALSMSVHVSHAARPQAFLHALPPWLDKNDLGCVPLLVESAVSDLREPIVVCATHHNLVHVLDLMVQLFAAHACSDYLVVRAADPGHVSILAYLYVIVYRHRLKDAARIPSVHGHIHVLEYFLHQEHELIESWIDVSVLQSRAWTVGALQWLLEMIIAYNQLEGQMNQPTALPVVEERCLDAAEQARQIPTMIWLRSRLVASNSGDALLRVVHRAPRDLKSSLVECMAPVPFVSDEALMQLCHDHWTDETLRLVFDTLACLNKSDGQRELAQERCLERALGRRNVRVATWLMETMSSITTQRVLRSASGQETIAHAIKTREINNVLLVESHGAQVDRAAGAAAAQARLWDVTTNLLPLT